MEIAVIDQLLAHIDLLNQQITAQEQVIAGLVAALKNTGADLTSQPCHDAPIALAAA